VFLDERRRIVDSRRDPRIYSLAAAAARGPQHCGLGHLRKRASMHDLTATLFHVVCGCVQRIRVPDLIRITPFLSTGRSAAIARPIICTQLSLGCRTWSEEFLSWLFCRTFRERTVGLLSRRIEKMISVVRRPTKESKP
jgi:hypothetical protein